MRMIAMAAGLGFGLGVLTGPTLALTPPPLTPGESMVALDAAPHAFDRDAVSLALIARLAAADPAARDGVAALYASRAHAPLWTDGLGLSAAGVAVLTRLARADGDGLDPAAFAVAPLPPDPSPEAGADQEIAIARAIVAYAGQASGGRVDTTRLGKLVTVRPEQADPFAALVAVASAGDPAAALEAFNPPHEGFRRLRAKLAALRAEDQAIAAAAVVRLPEGPVLKPGMSHPRVALLRERLGLTASDVYDDATVAAVRAFQRQARIAETGLAGPVTIAALNREAHPDIPSLEAEIIANMERWRWLPRDLGETHVLVNVPAFSLSMVRDGVPIHQAKVIVGKPQTPTPIFSDVIEFAVVNPSWHVPVSIIRNEYLPKLRKDPSYLSRKGFEVVANGRRVDSTAVDWSRPGRIAVRQPPGAANALGHIKFMFPNEHSVYLHDTSSRQLFANERRAYSHGCVRVDQPFRLAELLLGAGNGWTEERVRRMIGGREQRINLATPVPVHLAYFTAEVDEAGELVLFDDLYGYDRKVLTALAPSN